MSDFKKNGYYVVKNVISEEICDFAYEYMYMRAENLKTYKKYNYISDLEEEFGSFNDTQAPNAFSIYGSLMTDMFLLNLKPVVEMYTGLQLEPNYSYLRIYVKDNELKKHKDRPECEISTTLHLGGDTEWPIFLNDKKIILEKGDMLIYRGCDFVHWREPYKGITYCQTFLHYSDINGPIYKNVKFDGRPHLGLPAWFKNK